MQVSISFDLINKTFLSIALKMLVHATFLFTAGNIRNQDTEQWPAVRGTLQQTFYSSL